MCVISYYAVKDDVNVLSAQCNTVVLKNGTLTTKGILGVTMTFAFFSLQ
jgi:hypothetical protein